MKLTVISGGQTGVDTAALLAARLIGFKTGGMMPQGYRTQQGDRPWYAYVFGMEEHESRQYPPRTESNVKQSDLTIAIAGDFNSPGEILTKKLCGKHKKECIQVPLEDTFYAHAQVVASLVRSYKNVRVINVAGNSEDTCPGITDLALVWLVDLFYLLKD